MLRAAEERGGAWIHGHDLRATPEARAEATIDCHRLFVGKPTVAQNGSDDTGLAPRLAQLEAEGKTVVLVRGGQPLGLVALADEVRPVRRSIPLHSGRSLSCVGHLACDLASVGALLVRASALRRAPEQELADRGLREVLRPHGCRAQR
jgi:hypothetical protein